MLIGFIRNSFHVGSFFDFNQVDLDGKLLAGKYALVYLKTVAPKAKIVFKGKTYVGATDDPNDRMKGILVPIKEGEKHLDIPYTVISEDESSEGRKVSDNILHIDEIGRAHV